METLTRLLPLPPKDFRSKVTQLIEESKTQEALDALGSHFEIEPPKRISLTEAERIDPVGYEDFIGSGAEAAQIPSTNYLTFLPESEREPRYVVHEFYEYLFDKIGPPPLLPHEVRKWGNDWLAFLMTAAWRNMP
ncbi:hypothetical protein ES703_108675 [subsurface metagenome]